MANNSKTGPFHFRTHINHSNTRIVRTSDVHCILIVRLVMWQGGASEMIAPAYSSKGLRPGFAFKHTFFDCYRQSIKPLLHPSTYLSIHPSSSLITLDLPVLYQHNFFFQKFRIFLRLCIFIILTNWTISTISYCFKNSLQQTWNWSQPVVFGMSLIFFCHTTSNFRSMVDHCSRHIICIFKCVRYLKLIIIWYIIFKAH
jgi:hypothetical protein